MSIDAISRANPSPPADYQLPSFADYERVNSVLDGECDEIRWAITKHLRASIERYRGGYQLDGERGGVTHVKLCTTDWRAFPRWLSGETEACFRGFTWEATLLSFSGQTATYEVTVALP